jgi:hypothetical protein
MSKRDDYPRFAGSIGLTSFRDFLTREIGFSSYESQTRIASVQIHPCIAAISAREKHILVAGVVLSSRQFRVDIPAANCEPGRRVIFYQTDSRKTGLGSHETREHHGYQDRRYNFASHTFLIGSGDADCYVRTAARFLHYQFRQVYCTEITEAGNV